MVSMMKSMHTELLTESLPATVTSASPTLISLSVKNRKLLMTEMEIT